MKSMQKWAGIPFIALNAFGTAHAQTGAYNTPNGHPIDAYGNPQPTITELCNRARKNGGVITERCAWNTFLHGDDEGPDLNTRVSIWMHWHDVTETDPETGRPYIGVIANSAESAQVLGLVCVNGNEPNCTDSMQTAYAMKVVRIDGKSLVFIDNRTAAYFDNSSDSINVDWVSKGGKRQNATYRISHDKCGEASCIVVADSDDFIRHMKASEAMTVTVKATYGYFKLTFVTEEFPASKFL